MRRSSSKLITRARSVRNMGKVPFKFKFDLVVSSVEKLAASGDVVVVWDRSNNKVESTKPAKIDRNTRKANFGNEQLTAEITLFKTQPSDKKFQDKCIKLAVKANAADGKTLGKILLNLADYAEVPSGSKTFSAELTNGAAIVASIQCVFISMGKTPPGKGAIPGKSDNSDSDSITQEAEAGWHDTEDAPANFLKNKLKMGRAVSKKFIARGDKKARDDENNSDFANNADTIERLKKENNRLKKQLEEANNGSSDSKLAEENQRLKREVRDLQIQLSREPVYADVVRELKEAKMGLAFMHMEKEKVALELMKYQRGELQASVKGRR
eukprot:GFKZ01004175.1.p2 GENE.GFKZ01004175.1~~GFKZ01004175.1.p2  ORF type:complete len:326 (+),score=61.15 GFKZ01004175.1:708-1685(+)